MTCSKSRIKHKQLLFEGACDEAAILCTIYMILHDVAISGCFCCLHSILASFVSELFLEDGVHVQPIVTCMRLITCLLLLLVICSCTLPFITCAQVAFFFTHISYLTHLFLSAFFIETSQSSQSDHLKVPLPHSFSPLPLTATPCLGYTQVTHMLVFSVPKSPHEQNMQFNISL